MGNIRCSSYMLPWPKSSWGLVVFTYGSLWKKSCNRRIPSESIIQKPIERPWISQYKHKRQEVPFDKCLTTWLYSDWRVGIFRRRPPLKDIFSILPFLNKSKSQHNLHACTEIVESLIATIKYGLQHKKYKQWYIAHGTKPSYVKRLNCRWRVGHSEYTFMT